MNFKTSVCISFCVSRDACFSCAACQDDGELPEDFFVNLSEAEDHVRTVHKVTEDIHMSINLPKDRESLTPFKCKFCQSPFLFPSKLQLDKHIVSTHGKHFATKANRFSKRVCRLCHRMLEEQEKHCKDCKSRIETFATGQSKSSDVSINPLILAIFALFVGILAFLIQQYLK